MFYMDGDPWSSPYIWYGLAGEGLVGDNPRAFRKKLTKYPKEGGPPMPTAQTTILPDHILAAVLTLAKRESKEEKRYAFQSYDFQLQKVFHDLQRNKEYSLLDAFVFSDSGPEPYSPVLNESVSRLQLSGLIGRENPDYEVVFLQDAADQFYDEVLSFEFSAPEIQQLTKIASEFFQRVDKI